MPFNMTIRPVAVALLAAASLALLFMGLRAEAAHAACKGGASAQKAKAARAMFCYINSARRARGLPALRNDFRLKRVAARHAGEMVRMRFFGHNSPRSGKLVTRVKRSGFAPSNRQWWAGENLGFGTGRAQGARRVFVGWMGSPIHEKAILYRNFNRMGVGVSRGTPMGGPQRGALTYVVTFGG